MIEDTDNGYIKDGWPSPPPLEMKRIYKCECYECKHQFTATGDELKESLFGCPKCGELDEIYYTPTEGKI